MSVALAFAQTTIALREVLQTALRLDAGWRSTGGATRVTVLPHGKPDKGSGERLNLAMVAASPIATLRNRPPEPGEAALPQAFDLRYLITVHVLFPLHAELLIGATLDALHASPVLVAPSGLILDDPLEAAVMASGTFATDQPPRVTVEVAEARSFDILRVPALLLHVSPVIAAPQQTPLALLIGR